MEKASRNIFVRLISTVLAIVMLLIGTLNVFAVSRSAETLYIQDVKLIYADSLQKAKNSVPEGYTLIEEDLNEGTGSSTKVYFAYSTTQNPDEAITDIKMMNMKGGFVLSDYEEQLQDVKESVRKLANDVKIAAEMFSVKYVEGTYGAKAAYRALSAFVVDDAGGKTLADHLIYDKPGEDFYIKFVLNAHRDVLSAVLSALAMAVQGEIGDTWLDRLAALEDPSDVDELPGYWDDASTLWEHFYGFYKVYNTINHSIYNEGNVSAPPEEGSENSDAPPTVDPVDPEAQPDIAYNGTEALYEIAYKVLEAYQFESGETFSEWFLGEDVFVYNEELVENFFPILAVMTPEELAMMRLCGPLYMILATGMDENAYQDYLGRIEEITGGEAVCSIWEGVNYELFHSSIGITDEAARKIAETEFEKELNNEGDSVGSAGLKTAGLIVACGAVALGSGYLSLVGFAGAGLAGAINGAGATAAAVTTAGTIFGCAMMAAGVAIVVVALVVALVFFIVWLAEIYAENHPEYTEIPEFMYDYVEDGAGNNQFVLYEGVKFQDGKIADVNVWKGKEWHAMYISRDKAAGAPIEDDVIVRKGDGRIDKGFAGLSNFGHVNAQNLNGYDFDDEVGGVFITYRQEDLEGDYARKDYLSGVRLFCGENADKVRADIKNEGYVCYDLNLTPDSDHVTYLGYRTTNYESRALTDIRLAYGYNTQQYTTGGGGKTSYGASGSTGDGMLTLYTTSISLFGTPIKSDFLVLDNRNAPAGYEPVNLVSGGPAVNVNLRDGAFVDTDKQMYIYFLPSETYTGGTEYLGGLTVAFDAPSGAAINGKGSIGKAKDILGYNVLYTSTGNEHAEAAILYTTTYNPYRAIYNVTAAEASSEKGTAFAQTLVYDGVGYSLATRYTVTGHNTVRYESAAQRAGDARLYVAGIYSGGSPMMASEIYASGDQNGAPHDGMLPVTDRLSDDGRAVNLGSGLKFVYHQRVSAEGGVAVTKLVNVAVNPFYLFISGRERAEGNYLTDIYLVSKEDMINSMEENSDIDCDDIDNAYVLNQLSMLGAHRVILKNLNLADSDNLTYLGFTKKAREEDSTALLKPITNIVLYYAGKTDAPPEQSMTFGRFSYQLAGNMNLFCEEGETNDKCERVYLYYTTNPSAGSSIIDIKIDHTAILNGWETAKTQNGKALYADMDDYESSMWFIHMKRTTEDPKYISEIVVGVGGSDADAKAELIAAGCDYMLEKDLNDNVGIHSDYVYLGYKRTGNSDEAIRDIVSVHDEDYTTLTKNGATYYKVEGNLNSYTNIFADDIYLFYTRDAKAGTPLTSLGTSSKVENWSHGEGGRYVVSTVLDQNGKPSDLNDGAGGDYIYLLQTRDKQDEKVPFASVIASGSVIAIVACVLLSAGAITWCCIARKKRRKAARRNEI